MKFCLFVNIQLFFKRHLRIPLELLTFLSVRSECGREWGSKTDTRKKRTMAGEWWVGKELDYGDDRIKSNFPMTFSLLSENT